MKIFVEFESGDRYAARLVNGDRAPVALHKTLVVKYVAWDESRRMWIYSEDLTGPWHWYDVSRHELRRIDL